MPRLMFDTKWTVLDVENAEPNEAAALIATFSELKEEEAKAYIREHLQVAIDGGMKSGSELNVYVGTVNATENSIEIKHLSVEWDASVSAEDYADEFGEALYMELEHEGAYIPFMAHESFQIVENRSEQPSGL